MKKLFFALIASVLLVASCTPEDLNENDQLIDKDKVETPNSK